MKEITAGDIYRHINSGSLYTIKGVCPIKIDGVWISKGAVVYFSEDSGITYVRLSDDFIRAFEPAS